MLTLEQLKSAVINLHLRDKLLIVVVVISTLLGVLLVHELRKNGELQAVIDQIKTKENSHLIDKKISKIDKKNKKIDSSLRKKKKKLNDLRRRESGSVSHLTDREIEKYWSKG